MSCFGGDRWKGPTDSVLAPHPRFPGRQPLVPSVPGWPWWAEYEARGDLGAGKGGGRSPTPNTLQGGSTHDSGEQPGLEETQCWGTVTDDGRTGSEQGRNHAGKGLSGNLAATGPGSSMPACAKLKCLVDSGPPGHPALLCPLQLPPQLQSVNNDCPEHSDNT